MMDPRLPKQSQKSKQTQKRLFKAGPEVEARERTKVVCRGALHLQWAHRGIAPARRAGRGGSRAHWPQGRGGKSGIAQKRRRREAKCLARQERDLD